MLVLLDPKYKHPNKVETAASFRQGGGKVWQGPSDTGRAVLERGWRSESQGILKQWTQLSWAEGTSWRTWQLGSVAASGLNPVGRRTKATQLNSLGHSTALKSRRIYHVAETKWQRGASTTASFYCSWRWSTSGVQSAPTWGTTPSSLPTAIRHRNMFTQHFRCCFFFNFFNVDCI